MPETARQGASGLQIAFLIFALVFLCAPADKYVFDRWQWAKEIGFPIGRTMIFVIAGAILVSVPALRRSCMRLLSTRIPAGSGKEMAVVLALQIIALLGAIGAFALWHWSTGGESALAKAMGESSSHAEQWSRYVSVHGVVTSLLLGGFIGPVIEELVFRGMLYPAWATRWGWIASALATSAVFGWFHSTMLSQFMGSLLLIGLLRRTGALWACIIAHSVFNILLWYPLLGRFLFPPDRNTGELWPWTPHLICLFVTLFAIPVYMWMSRDEKAALPAVSTQAALRQS